MKYIQKGDNPKYPQEVIIWRDGDHIPSWISDNAKILSIDPFGEYKLFKRNTTSGGYEIVASDGIRILVSTKTPGSYVCYDGKRIFSLTEKQFSLLYEPKKRC